MFRYTLRALLILLAVGPALFALESRSAERKHGSAEVLALILAMPDWPLLPVVADNARDKNAKARGLEIERLAKEIAQYDSESIKTAFRQLIDSDTVASLHALEKLYWLNKYVFDIPGTIERRSPHFVMLVGSGWYGMPITGNPRDPQPSDVAKVLWPWLVDSKGNLRFQVERRLLMYNGPPYEALTVFEYCERQFGRR